MIIPALVPTKNITSIDLLTPQRIYSSPLVYISLLSVSTYIAQNFWNLVQIFDGGGPGFAVYGYSRLTQLLKVNLRQRLFSAWRSGYR